MVTSTDILELPNISGEQIAEMRARLRADRTIAIREGVEIRAKALMLTLGCETEEELVTEGNIVTGALRLANGEAQFSYGRLFGSAERERWLEQFAAVEGKEAADKLAKDIPPEAEVYAALRATTFYRINDPDKLRAYFVKDMLPRLEEMPISLRVQQAPNGFRLTIAAEFLHEPEIVSLYAMLLLDDSRPYGRDLCCCKLEECGRFFLVQKPITGRPRRDYCCSAHMLESHSRRATARTRTARKRKKEKQSKRK